MRKILIELQIDWEGYEDVSDELIVEDAIEAKVEGVSWTLLRQPIVKSSKSSSKTGLKDKNIIPYSEWAKKLRDL